MKNLRDSRVWLPSLGSRVHHPKWGGGTVVELRSDGRCRVRFDQRPRLPRYAFVEELAIERSSNASNKLSTMDRATARGMPSSNSPRSMFSFDIAERDRPTPFLPAMSQEQLEAHAILASLRLGCVPERGASRYAVGVKRLRKSFREWTERLPAFRVVEGDYGTGKTLSLRCFAEWALDYGFLVAFVSLDPSTARWPRWIWRELVASLHIPGEPEGGLLTFLAQVAERAPELFDPHHALYSHQLSPIAFLTTCSEVAPTDWLAVRSLLFAEGGADRQEVAPVLHRAGWRQHVPYKFPRARTVGHLLSHYCSTLASWSQVVGYRGFVLLLDECDRVASPERPDDLDYIKATMEYLMRLTHPRRRRALRPGGHQGLRNNVPFRVGRRPPLLVVAADTEEGLRATLGYSELEAIAAPRFDNRSADALARRIADLYAVAHPGVGLRKNALDSMFGSVRRLLDGGRIEPRPRHLVHEVLHQLDQIWSHRKAS